MLRKLIVTQETDIWSDKENIQRIQRLEDIGQVLYVVSKNESIYLLDKDGNLEKRISDILTGFCPGDIVYTNGPRIIGNLVFMFIGKYLPSGSKVGELKIGREDKNNPGNLILNPKIVYRSIG